MIGKILSSIRLHCGFSVDMMATAMCMEYEDYLSLEYDLRMATDDERSLAESLYANLIKNV